MTKLIYVPKAIAEKVEPSGDYCGVFRDNKGYIVLTRDKDGKKTSGRVYDWQAQHLLNAMRQAGVVIDDDKEGTK